MIISRGGGGGQVGILDTSKNNLKQFPYSDIQLSEKQQLRLSWRLLKYSEDRDTGWERNKLKTRETLPRGVYGRGIHPCTQMEKKKTELQLILKVCIHILTLHYPEEWSFFTYLDPDFANDQL